jgi:hypothetical protein
MSMPIGNDKPAMRPPTAPVGLSRYRRDKSAAPSLTCDQVWQALEKASVAVLGHVTPSGQPRTSGVVYEAVARHIFVAVAPESWKARHIAACGHVSVTVLVRRGGLLSLLFPIPPATITFHGTAVVHAAGAPEATPILARLKRLLPPARAQSACLIEIAPEGEFLTYGIGVPLMTMRDPAAARGHVPVSSG